LWGKGKCKLYQGGRRERKSAARIGEKGESFLRFGGKGEKKGQNYVSAGGEGRGKGRLWARGKGKEGKWKERKRIRGERGKNRNPFLIYQVANEKKRAAQQPVKKKVA